VPRNKKGRSGPEVAIGCQKKVLIDWPWKGARKLSEVFPKRNKWR